MTTAKTATLAEALVAAWAKMPVVKEKSKGNFGAYLDLDTLIDQTRPILSEHGLAIIQLPVRGDDGMPMLRTMILHTSGESIQADAPLAPEPANPRNSAMQLLGGSVTYMRRYAWASACGIASEHDNDAQKPKQTPKDAPKPDVPDALQAAESERERRELQEAVQAGIDRLGAVDENWTLEATLLAATESFGREITALADLDNDELGKILGAMPAETVAA
jgi:hypothetical protein